MNNSSSRFATLSRILPADVCNHSQMTQTAIILTPTRTWGERRERDSRQSYRDQRRP